LATLERAPRLTVCRFTHAGRRMPAPWPSPELDAALARAYNAQRQGQPDNCRMP
jgi:hypothetical protein